MDDHLSFEGIQDTLSLGSAKNQETQKKNPGFAAPLLREEVYNPLDGVDLQTDTFRFSGSRPVSGPAVPDDFEEYKTKLLRHFAPLDEALVERLFGEKLLVSAYKGWNPKDPRSNLLIAQRSFDILARAMGDTYRFAPATLAFGATYRDNAVGLFLYGKGWEKVVLSKVLLTRPFTSLLEVMVHEQIHRLQHSLICRLNQVLENPLPKEVHSLVLYWLRDEPNRVKGYEEARRRPREARAILRRIAIEYHAYERSEYVIRKLFP